MTWEVQIRNAAGTTVTRIVTAATSGRALTSALKAQALEAGGTWYAFRCHPKGF